MFERCECEESEIVQLRAVIVREQKEAENDGNKTDKCDERWGRMKETMNEYIWH